MDMLNNLWVSYDIVCIGYIILYGVKLLKSQIHFIIGCLFILYVKLI